MSLRGPIERPDQDPRPRHPTTLGVERLGLAVDGEFEGTIAGSGFAAEMSIRSSNRRQTVVMRPRGGDIDKVDIILSRES